MLHELPQDVQRWTSTRRSRFRINTTAILRLTITSIIEKLESDYYDVTIQIEELEEEITEIQLLVSTTMKCNLRTSIMDTNNGTSWYDVVVIVLAYFNYSQCPATEYDETTAGLYDLNIINESPTDNSCKVDEDDNDTHSIPTETSSSQK